MFLLAESSPVGIARFRPGALHKEVDMAYRFVVNRETCINCGICMDLCPVRCLDMTRPSGEGEPGSAGELLSPIPGSGASRAWTS